MRIEEPKITVEEALAKFDGKRAKLAEFLDIKRAAVYQWKELVPTERAYQLIEVFPDLDKRSKPAASRKTRNTKSAA